MRVFSPSVGNRVIVLMPDLPPVSFAQLSDFPAPSDVTTPRPVTTTSGRPILSLPVAISASLISSLNQTKAFASPVSHSGHQDLGQVPGERFLQTRRVARRKQTTMSESHRGQRDIHWKLWFQPMPEI